MLVMRLRVPATLPSRSAENARVRPHVPDAPPFGVDSRAAAARRRDSKSVRQAPRRALLHGESQIVVDGLIDRRHHALCPDEERARAVLALPLSQGAAAGGTMERRRRLVQIEHSHGAALATRA